MLSNKDHLRPAYGVLFGMPGVPAVYYGALVVGHRVARAVVHPAVVVPVEGFAHEDEVRLEAVCESGAQ